MRFIGKKNFDDLLIGPEDNGQKQIQNQIIEFVMHLRDQNLARSNIAGHVSAIKHFYDMNDILSINWSMINKFKGDEQEQKHDRPYTRQEIKLLIDNALSLRDKAIISLLTSSGMRKGGIIDLRIKDLLSIEKYNLYRVTVYARSHDHYYTYCTPESRKYIDDYLAWRKRLGEKMTENSILFRKESDIRDTFEVRNIVKRLTLSGVTSIIRELHTT
jgi:site-specific recombinase XerD